MRFEVRHGTGDAPAARRRHALVVGLQRHANLRQRFEPVAGQFIAEHRVLPLAHPDSLLAPLFHLRSIRHIERELDRVAEDGHLRVRIHRDLANHERMLQVLGRPNANGLHFRPLRVRLSLHELRRLFELRAIRGEFEDTGRECILPVRATGEHAHFLDRHRMIEPQRQVIVLGRVLFGSEERGLVRVKGKLTDSGAAGYSGMTRSWLVRGASTAGQGAPAVREPETSRFLGGVVVQSVLRQTAIP